MPSTTSLKLPDELKEKISTLAHGVAQTPHAYMVDAIAEKVARDEKRREFLEAGRKSLEEYGRTGIAYVHEDVWRYVNALVKGRKAPKPRPIKRRTTKR